MNAAKDGGIRLLFDRRLRLEFRGAKITTDSGLRKGASRVNVTALEEAYVEYWEEY